MRRGRGPLALLSIILMTLLTAGPASAGGPTSVLLVVPGTGQTASLYASDADYQALAGLVGAFEPSGVAGAVDRSGAGHELGAGVTLTWLIHDVQVWRVDRVYVGADGGPWISTQSVDGAGTVWDSPVTWHTASRGKELATLLDRLGVTPSSPADRADAAPATAAADRAADRSERTAGEETDPGPTGWGGWVWGLMGLALGVGLTVAGTRLFPSEPSWSLTDELASPAQRT